MMRTHIHQLATAFAVALSFATRAFAANEVTIGKDKYEEVDRWVVGGEIIVRLKPQATAGVATQLHGAVMPEESSAKPAVAVATTATAAASSVPGPAAVMEKDEKSSDEQLQSAIDTIAKENSAEITNSQGLIALGVDAGEFVHATIPKDVLLTVGQGIDASGIVKKGAAVQFGLANVFFAKTVVGGKSYVDNPAMQMWARTSVELATAKSDNNLVGKQVAVAVTVGLIDGSDPRLFWAANEACAREQMRKLKLPTPTATAEVLEKFNSEQEALLKLANKCAASKWEDTAKGLWQEPRWYVGAGKGWNTGASDKAKDLKSGPAMAWTTYSIGFEKMNPKDSTVRTLTEFSLAKKWSLPVQDVKDEKQFLREDRVDAVARLRFSRDRWNAFIDGGVSRVTTDGVLSANVRRFGYGAQYKLNEDLWLVFGSVVERGYVSGDSKRTLLNLGLRFGQTSKEVLKPLGPELEKAVASK